MRCIGYAASLHEAVGWVNKQRADDPHPNPPPFRGRERTEIVARLLNHLAGVAHPTPVFPCSRHTSDHEAHRIVSAAHVPQLVDCENAHGAA
jgi:hypothetical protein